MRFIKSARKNHLVYQDIEVLRENVEVLQKQATCSAKGHKIHFKRYVYATTCFGYEMSESGFVFKCKNCGIEFSKTKAELTTIEKTALKVLKVLDNGGK